MPKSANKDPIENPQSDAIEQNKSKEITQEKEDKETNSKKIQSEVSKDQSINNTNKKWNTNKIEKIISIKSKKITNNSTTNKENTKDSLKQSTSLSRDKNINNEFRQDLNQKNLDQEELSEKSDYLVKFLNQNTKEAQTAIQMGRSIDKAITTNMFAFRWFIGLLQNMHPDVYKDLMDQLQKLQDQKNKELAEVVQISKRLECQYEVDTAVLFPIVSTHDFFDADFSVNFSNFNSQEVKLLIEVLQSGNVGNVSMFTTNLMVLMFLSITVLIVMLTCNSVEETWTNQVANPNIVFILALIFFQQTNAIIASPKLRSFVALSQIMHHNNVAQKWKIALLIWCQMIAIQFLSVAFISQNILQLLIGSLNGILLVKGVEFLIKQDDTMTAQNDPAVAVVLKMFENSTVVEQIDGNADIERIDQRNAYVNSVMSLYNFTSILVILYTLYFQLDQHARLKKVNDKLMLFSFDSVNPKTGIEINNLNKLSNVITNSAENIKNFVRSFFENTNTDQEKESNTESNSVSNLNDNSTYFNNRINILGKENKELKDNNKHLNMKLNTVVSEFEHKFQDLEEKLHS